jgi:multiple sugar transport system permease protein
VRTPDTSVLARTWERRRLNRRPRARTREQTREALAAYVFLLPWLVGLFGLTLGPMLASLALSFTHFDLLSPPRWIGATNYQVLLTDDRYLHSVRVTLTYVFLEVPLKLTFALLLAVLLNQALFGVGLYRALFYVPSLLGGSAAIAILWRQIFSGDGMLNLLLGSLGWHHPPAWLQDPNFALQALVALGVWQFGSPMVIFLAGLRQIPRELYEAARVDGARRVGQFFRITVPLLTPLILFNFILQMVYAFQTFTPAFIVSGGSGSPVDSTLFYTLYLYSEAFGNLHMGYGAAMAWLLLVAIAISTAAVFASSRFWVFYMETAA